MWRKRKITEGGIHSIVTAKVSQCNIGCSDIINLHKINFITTHVYTCTIKSKV